MLRLLNIAFALLTLSAASAQDITIKPVKLLNGRSNMMAPMVIDSVLYFSSDKKVDFMVNYLDQNDSHFYKLYKISLKNKLPNGNAQLLFPDVTPFHQTAITPVADSDGYMVTQNLNSTLVRNRLSRGANPFTFVETNKNLRNIRRAKQVISTQGSVSVAYPSVSPDGNYLFFASDDGYGFGGTDIYYAIKEGEGWGKPINAGSLINTDGNEGYPFVAKSGKIFYSSSGRYDSKGADIYYTTFNDGKFSIPVKLDSIYNTPYDDFGIFMSDDESWGYLCSNRNGNDQIYYFENLFPSFPVVTPYRKENFCYTFYESSAEDYDTLQFDFKWMFGDGGVAYGIEADHCFKDYGMYEVELNVVDRVTGEDMFTVSNFEFEIERLEQVVLKYNGPIKKGNAVRIEADASSIKDFNINDYYWQIGDNTKRRGKYLDYTFPYVGKYVIKCGVVDAKNPQNKVCTSIEVEVVE